VSKRRKAGGQRGWQVRAREIAAPPQLRIIPMVVIALTAFVGLALVTLFIFLFVCYAASGGGIEHEALLPLEDETPVVIATRQP
jgi:hypothetical protein